MCRRMAGAALSCYRTPQPSLWKNQWSLRNVTWRWLITIPFRGNWSAGDQLEISWRSAGDQLVRHVEASWLDRYAHDRILEVYPIPLLSMFWPRNSFPSILSCTAPIPMCQVPKTGGPAGLFWWNSKVSAFAFCIRRFTIYQPAARPARPARHVQLSSAITVPLGTSFAEKRWSRPGLSLWTAETTISRWHKFIASECLWLYDFCWIKYCKL